MKAVRGRLIGRRRRLLTAGENQARNTRNKTSAETIHAFSFVLEMWWFNMVLPRSVSSTIECLIAPRA